MYLKDRVYKVTVLDMQPIDPPFGGGRLRLLGLYHGLGANLPTTYVGTYDWPGEKFRKHKLSDTLEEVDIPLSKEHFAEAEKWRVQAGGRTIIDTSFHQLAHLSPQFVEYAKSEASKADIVIFSHPWVYPLVKDILRQNEQLIVYDAHNMEGLLRATLLDDGAFGSEIVKEAVKAEYELCRASDIILACSHEDSELFHRLYHMPFSKIRTVPNGVFTKQILPASGEDKEKAKRELGLESRVMAIFIGSAYPPNIEAANFICQKLAPALPHITFAICGGVGEAINKVWEGASNIHVTGMLEEKEKLKYLAAADLALNPMVTGSGTNIKMFDFMAAGLPVLTTPVGARGIEDNTSAAFKVCYKSDFVPEIIKLTGDLELWKNLSKNARVLTEEKYSWERISPDLGCMLKEALLEKRQSPRVIAETKIQLALLTPWGIPCGIAEYSKYLVDSLNRHNVKCLILSNINKGSKNCGPKNKTSSSTAIEEIWKYGNIKAEDVVNICRNAFINKLSIQYNAAFFNEESLIDVVSKCIEARIDVSVTLHNTKIMEVGSLLKIGNMGALLIVHNIDELKRLSSLGVKGLSHIPHGVLEVPDEPAMAVREQLGISSSPVIGSFGFLRPHKGLIELIRATAILREQFPNMVLFAMNALYPSEDSKKYLIECNDCINSLGLTNHILLHTQFLEIEHIIRKLHVCDLIVLPYLYSNEGASGSVNIAIAAKRPVLTTREEIFKECSDTIYQLKGNAPHILSAGIASVLSNPMLLRTLKRKTEKYIETNSWNSVADKYLELILKQ